MTTRIETDAAMRDLGRRLAGLLRAGDLVILAGPLGAGKTTLVQGIGAGLGVRGPVTSPTFVIARVHPVVSGASGSGPRWCTRTPTGWAASARWTTWTWTPTPRPRSRWWSGAPVWPRAWPQDRLEISIEPDLNSDVRTVQINGHGARWHDVLTEAVDRL